MKTIDFYLDTAKKNHAIQSDAQLAKRLGLSTGAISQMRTRRTWPSDDTMLKLAELVSCDPHAALLELNTWRSSGKTLLCYKALLERLNGALTTAFIVIFITLQSASSAYSAQEQNTNILKGINIITHTLSRFKRFLSAFLYAWKKRGELLCTG